MQFYTAGPFKDRDYVREVRGALQVAGYKVKADWLDIDATSDEAVLEAYLKEMALVDLKDVIAADCLIYCNTGTLSEGKATELGVAIAMLKPVIIVGPGGRKNNIFCHLNIPYCENIDLLVAFLKAQEGVDNQPKTGV